MNALIRAAAIESIRENKWRAARFGLDAEVIVSNTGDHAPLRGEIYGLLERLAPTASEVACTGELQAVAAILHGANSSGRQRTCFGEHGSLPHVVALLTDELRTDAEMPEKSPESGVPSPK